MHVNRETIEAANKKVAKQMSHLNNVLNHAFSNEDDVKNKNATINADAVYPINDCNGTDDVFADHTIVAISPKLEVYILSCGLFDFKRMYFWTNILTGSAKTHRMFDKIRAAIFDAFDDDFRIFGSSSPAAIRDFIVEHI